MINKKSLKIVLGTLVLAVCLVGIGYYYYIHYTIAGVLWRNGISITEDVRLELEQDNYRVFLYDKKRESSDPMWEGIASDRYIGIIRLYKGRADIWKKNFNTYIPKAEKQGLITYPYHVFKGYAFDVHTILGGYAQASTVESVHIKVADKRIEPDVYHVDQNGSMYFLYLPNQELEESDIEISVE